MLVMPDSLGNLGVQSQALPYCVNDHLGGIVWVATTAALHEVFVPVQPGVADTHSPVEVEFDQVLLSCTSDRRFVFVRQFDDHPFDGRLKRFRGITPLLLQLSDSLLSFGSQGCLLGEEQVAAKDQNRIRGTVSLPEDSHLIRPTVDPKDRGLQADSELCSGFRRRYAPSCLGTTLRLFHLHIHLLTQCLSLDLRRATNDESVQGFIHDIPS